jgi:hypothetical protein
LAISFSAAAMLGACGKFLSETQYSGETILKCRLPSVAAMQPQISGFDAVDFGDQHPFH